MTRSACWRRRTTSPDCGGRTDAAPTVVIDHPQQGSIDAAIEAGTRPLKAIAADHGVAYDSLRRYARRLIADPQRVAPATAPAMTAVQTFEAAFHMEPTDYQVALLSDRRPTIFLKSRQVGATQSAAALAIATARARPGADALVISPSQDQSKEVTGRARLGLYELEEPLVQDAAELLRLRNGSRIISRPGNQRAVRGYAPSLVIADEASWIADETYAALRPLLAASHGRLVAQSTPGARIGWFFDLWQTDLGDDWLRLEVRAEAVPFIDVDFLERERRELSAEVFAAEYGCTFGGVASAPKLFDMDAFEAVLVYDDAPEEVPV
jgi:hypothetical protein